MPVHTAYNLVCFVVSLTVAAASFFLVEAPLRRRITERFAPGRSHTRARPALAFAASPEPPGFDPATAAGPVGG